MVSKIKSRLKAVDPKATEPSKPKIVIYGKPGVGKTWGALDFHACYYIDTEGGADLPHYTDKLKNSGGVYLGIEQGSLDFETVLDQIKALATEDHPYKTLVIDSISKLFNNEITKESERLAKSNTKNEFGLDRKPAVSAIKSMVSWLQRIDMNVVMIAHEKALWGMVNGNRSEIGVTFDCYDKLEYELHLCLNIIKNGDKRIAKVKKTRLLGFPDADTFSWSYMDFATRYGKDVIEKETKKLILASPEQILELNNLLGVFSLPIATQEKWLTAANAATFEEMDESKIAQIIKHIKDKIPKITTEGE